MVRNQSQILTNDDAFVGFKRLKELFSTYLLKNVLTIVLGSSAILILSIILGLFLAEASTKLSSQAVLSNDYTQIISSVANLPVSMLAVVLLFYLITIILMFVISSYFFAVPYLLERYHMKNMNAIK